jgi:hypothetical protein
MIPGICGLSSVHPRDYEVLVPLVLISLHSGYMAISMIVDMISWIYMMNEDDDEK